MIRNILAVIAGFSAWTVLWFVSNGALFAALPDLFQADGTTSHNGILGCVLGVSLVCSVLGGYVTALVAVDRPLRPVWTLAL